MRIIEHELKLITDEQGSSVSELVELVKDNEKILKAMQVRVHNILIIIHTSDSHCTYIFSIIYVSDL